jgi:hypothetical protein
MVKRSAFTILLSIFAILYSPAQLKFLVDDFEGMGEGDGDLKENGFFTFGTVSSRVERSGDNHGYSGKRAFRVTRSGRQEYGGWGKGVGLNIGLDADTDHLNFYVLTDKKNGPVKWRIEIQEDDDFDHIFKKERDDVWEHHITLAARGEWEFVSIPLKAFKDANPGGDGDFNVGQYGGRLFVLLFSLPDADKLPANMGWTFDFICFSKGVLPRGQKLFDAPPSTMMDFCALGAWSSEGNSANFADIPRSFEGIFGGGKKLGVAHFFQSFSVAGDGGEYHYPSVERINRVIEAGYIPMITLEDHFVNASSQARQPNIYSIVEGHFDSFFGYWAHHIKQVKGVVLLRILHEFNGDWYPWCTVKNDRKGELVARAFRYIHNIFRDNNVNNVRFIWCPNSMSVPQESWNNIMDAYPGDEYVDFVGLDIYNGAGDGKGANLWRSFRKEGIENYFVLTQQKPGKPLFICEAASRERRISEGGQSKAEWIDQMSEALRSDMSKARLLAWFNEKETFKVQSSNESQRAYQDHIMKNPYFRDGTQDLEKLLRR